MASCSLNDFKNKFNETEINETLGLISLKNVNSKESVFQYIDIANSQAAAQGFDVNLYEIIGEDTISFLPEVHQSYENYINNILSPQMTNDIFDEKVENNRINDVLEMAEIEPIISEDIFEKENPEIELNSRILKPTIRSYNGSYTSWINSRKELVEELNKKLQNEFKKGKKGDKERKKELIDLIKKINSEIESFGKDASSDFVNSVNAEITELSIILDSLLNQDDIESSINVFFQSFFEKRLSELLNLTETEKGENVHDFIKEGIGNDAFNDLQLKIFQLEKKYNDSINTIVSSIVTNDEYFVETEKIIEKQIKEAEKEEIPALQEELEKWQNFRKDLNDAIKEGRNVEGDSLLGQYFLSGASYNSPLTNIASTLKLRNLHQEFGITKNDLKDLESSFKELMKTVFEKNSQKVKFTDFIWERDIYGIHTNNIIDYISPFHYKFISEHNQNINSFYKAGITSKPYLYSSAMNFLKENTTIIDFSKIKGIREQYKNDSRVKFLTDEFPVFSEQEMENYENELRDTLGDIGFKVELENALNQYEEYLNSELTGLEAFQNNPLLFAKNFNSDNFQKIDKTTGRFLLPRYSQISPNRDSINEEFKEVEKIVRNQRKTKEFEKFYKSFKAINTYIDISLKNEGISKARNSVMGTFDLLNREVLNDLKNKGKTDRSLQKFSRYRELYFRHITEAFRKNKYENAEGNPEYDINKDRKFNTHYSNAGYKEIEAIFDRLMLHSKEDLVKKANELGITFFKVSDIISIEVKKELVDAIARKTIQREMSLDVLERISAELYIAQSINARRETEGVVKLFSRYADLMDLPNLKSFLKRWNAMNILEVGNMQSSRNFFTDFIGKADRFKLSKKFIKKYSIAEKRLKKLLEKEKENIEGRKYKFDFGGFSYYYGINDKYYVTNIEDLEGINAEEISKEKVEAIYREYIDNEIGKLGFSLTLGDVLTGLGWQTNLFYLGFNPLAGWNNSVQGQNQARVRAASGDYGFGLDEYSAARKFLFSGTTVRELLNLFFLGKANEKLEDMSSLVGLKAANKREQLKVFRHIAESLHLVDNVATDLKGGDGTNAAFKDMKGISSWLASMAIDIPEFQNQMVSAVALMMNPKFAIKDINGNSRLLFDPHDKKGQLFPFDTKTMKLLPEYRTPENIANWENFTKDANGNAPQMVLLQLQNSNRDAINGNYSMFDRIGVASTAIGKSSIIFQKWYFEVVDKEWGYKAFDMNIGEKDVQGLSRNLLKHPTLFLSYYLLQSGTFLTGGLSSAVFRIMKGDFKELLKDTASLGIAGVGIAQMIKQQRRKVKQQQADTIREYNSILSYIRNMIRRKSIEPSLNALRREQDKVNERKSKELDLLGSWLTEVGALSWNTTLKSLSFNRLDESNRILFSKESIKKIRKTNLKEYWENNTLTPFQRNQLGQKAQNVANSVKATVIGYLLLTGLKSIHAIIQKLNDCYSEECIDELQGKFQGYANKIVNITNQATEPASVPISLDKMQENTFMLALYNKLSQDKKNIERLTDKYEKDELSWFDITLEAGKITLLPTVGVPKKVLKIAEDGSITTLFKDNKIYDKEQAGDMTSFAQNMFLSEEQLSKKLLSEKRNALKKYYEKQVRNRIKEDFKKTYKKDIGNSKLDKITEKVFRDLFRDTYKTDYNSYEYLYKNTDFKAIEEKLKKF